MTTALAVAVALAAISHIRGILFGRVGVGPLSLLARSEYGKLVIDVHRTDWCDVPRWQAATWPHSEPAFAPTIGGWWRYGGFCYSQGGTAGGITVHQLALPYWAVAVLALATRMALRKAETTRTRNLQ